MVPFIRLMTLSRNVSGELEKGVVKHILILWSELIYLVARKAFSWRVAFHGAMGCVQKTINKQRNRGRNINLESHFSNIWTKVSAFFRLCLQIFSNAWIPLNPFLTTNMIPNVFNSIKIVVVLRVSKGAPCYRKQLCYITCAIFLTIWIFYSVYLFHTY